MLLIESEQNPKVKLLASLKEKRGRKKHAKILIEGKREVLQADKAGVKLDSLFVESASIPEDLQALTDKVNTYQLTPALFDKLSYRSGGENCLAIAEPFYHSIKEIKKDGLYLILENIEKPGNLGAILRSADGAGVDGVFLCSSSHTDIHNPNVLRSSLGAVFHLPVVELSLSEVKSLLKDIQIVATSPYAKKNYWEIDGTKGLALLMGSEKDGISEEAKNIANEVVSIPMSGEVDSLNISAATSLLIYDIVRQRSL